MRFSEKYRPKKIDDLVGQESTKRYIKNLLTRKVFEEEYPPALLFVGKQGSGKTTLAYCLARELYGNEWTQYITELNASDERGIDVIRDKVKNFSMLKGRRIILLEEIDNMTDDAQQALRRIMELSRSTTFILTGNFDTKIIDPIKSRCVIFRFKQLEDNQILKKVLEICRAENIELNTDSKPVLMKLVSDSRGDLRSALNSLEKLINEKKEITEKALVEIEKPKMAVDAMNTALNGNFEDARKKMEDIVIFQNFSYSEIIPELYEGLSGIPNGDSKVWLFSKLAETEDSLRRGGTPVIQLVSFIADCYVANHVALNCIRS